MTDNLVSLDDARHQRVMALMKTLPHQAAQAFAEYEAALATAKALKCNAAAAILRGFVAYRDQTGWDRHGPAVNEAWRKAMGIDEATWQILVETMEGTGVTLE